MNSPGTKQAILSEALADWKKVVVPQDIEDLARITVDAAFAVHLELGPGLLESAYEACLVHELNSRCVGHQRQLAVPLQYRGTLIDVGFRADLLVASRLLIELKTVENLLPVHTAQVITYLRVLKLPLGLLINFNEPLIKKGIHRILNVPRTPSPA